MWFKLTSKKPLTIKYNITSYNRVKCTEKNYKINSQTFLWTSEYTKNSSEIYTCIIYPQMNSFLNTYKIQSGPIEEVVSRLRG